MSHSAHAAPWHELLAARILVFVHVHWNDLQVQSARGRCTLVLLFREV